MFQQINHVYNQQSAPYLCLAFYLRPVSDTAFVFLTGNLKQILSSVQGASLPNRNIALFTVYKSNIFQVNIAYDRLPPLSKFPQL